VIRGLPKMGINGFGRTSVKGRNLFPNPAPITKAVPISPFTSGRVADLEVRVEFLLENPPRKEGQPSDILPKSALRAGKKPNRVFSPRSGVSVGQAD
jgi:hypothetical protein